MSFSSTFRRPLLWALPAAVIFGACSKKDEPAAPAPDQANVLFVHAAPGANVAVKFLADDVQKAELAYGANSTYQTVLAGTGRTVKVNAGTTTAVTKTVDFVKGQSYTFFAYTPAAGTGVDGLLLADDLTAPGAGTAKVRVVHLASGAPSPVRLSQSTVAGPVDVPNASAAFGAGSPLVSVPAGSYNLLITAGTPSVTVLSVGDGTGTGTGTKNYEAGKIYTVLVRGNGLATNFDPVLQPKAVVIANN